MPITTALSAVWLASAVVAQASPVQTYTNAVNPSRSEGMFSNREYVPRADPRPDQLLNPAPYPSSRTDDPGREEIGRLWVSRHPVGNRTPLSEDTRVLNGGAANFGAPPEALDDVIFVKSNRRGVPIIAISPWQNLDANLTNEIRRDKPWLGSALRGRTLLSDLKHSQRLWLKEQGYILNVRTHISPRRIPGSTTRPASGIQPHAIIRVRPAPRDDTRDHVDATGAATTVPVTASDRTSVHRAPIVVVRRASAPQAAAQSNDG